MIIDLVMIGSVMDSMSDVDEACDERSCNGRSGDDTSRSCNDIFGDIGLVIL